jgi:site-specific DNA-cytosine methylase
MKIAVLFDGAGLARLGLEQAGHNCTGYELDPNKHHLSTYVGSGNCRLGEATTVELKDFDAIWASPPCQMLSEARTQGLPVSPYAGNFLAWALKLKTLYPKKIVWVENVYPIISNKNLWGTPYNAAQFLPVPIQNRPRLVAGNYPLPYVYRPFARQYNHLKICPTILASEYKGCASDKRRASRFYGRRLTLEECAFHQGFTIPEAWYTIPTWYTILKGQTGRRETRWKYNLYEAIGNGVPVYMARAFGEAIYSPLQQTLFPQEELA